MAEAGGVSNSSSGGGASRSSRSDDNESGRSSSSDSGSSRSSDSSSSSSASSSASQSVSSQQAEAARSEDDSREARSSDAARDAARAGQSVSAQQAAADDAKADKASKDDEARAAERGRAAVAAQDKEAATEAAKTGPAARDTVEKEMVARGQFQAVNDMARSLDAPAATDPAPAAPTTDAVSMDQAKAAADRAAYEAKAFDQVVAMEREARKEIASDAAARAAMEQQLSVVRTAPAMTPGDFAVPVADDVPNANVPGNVVSERALVGMDHQISIASPRGPARDKTGIIGMNVYETPEGYVAEVVANVQLNRTDAPETFGPPTARQAADEAIDQIRAERAMERFDGLSLGKAPDGRDITLDVSVNLSAHQAVPSLTVNVLSDRALARTTVGRAHMIPATSTINVSRSQLDSVQPFSSAPRATQDVVAHEFGHALGLPDEYEPSWPGYVDDRASIMSYGNEVRSRHGDTLGEIARSLLGR